jgi:hypothetical protein
MGNIAMLKALAGFVIGYPLGERRAAEAATPRESGSASGWLSAFSHSHGFVGMGSRGFAASRPIRRA